jgi:hypothetical protein
MSINQLAQLNLAAITHPAGGYYPSPSACFNREIEAMPFKMKPRRPNGGRQVDAMSAVILKA